jgi:hypothetical protein
MTETFQTQPSRLVSADMDGVGPNSHGALYSPNVTPAQRRMLDADRRRKAKFFKPTPRPAPPPVVEPPPRPAVVVFLPVKPKRTTRRQTLSVIMNEVAAEYGVPVPKLRAKIRKVNMVAARHLAMFLTLDIVKLGYSETARRFDHDHSSVWNAARKIEARLQSDSDYAAMVDRLKARILARISQ